MYVYVTNLWGMGVCFNVNFLFRHKCPFYECTNPQYEIPVSLRLENIYHDCRISEQAKSSPPDYESPTILKIDQFEYKNYAMRPMYTEVVRYLEKVMESPIVHDMDALIVTGGLCHVKYLMRRIKDMCATIGIEVIVPLEGGCAEPIVSGAMLNALDTIQSRGSLPEVMAEEENLSVDSAAGKASKLFVLIGNYNYM